MSSTTRCMSSRNAGFVASPSATAFASSCAPVAWAMTPGNTARSRSRARSVRPKTIAPFWPRSVFWIVVITVSACGNGDGWCPETTSPAKCEMSACSIAPTSRAMAANLAKSNWNGHDEPPAMIMRGDSRRARSQDLAVVEDAAGGDRVRDDPVVLAGVVPLEPVRQVAAVGEAERQDRVAPLQERPVDGFVAARAVRRLDVDVLASREALERALLRELLDLLHDPAGRVVEVPAVVLRVEERVHPLGLEDRGRRMVVARHEVDRSRRGRAARGSRSSNASGSVR